MNKSVVVDACLFFNELDILEIRLEEYFPFVSKFYILESTRTFTGKRKSLFFNDNKNRFSKFEKNIEHIILKDGNYPDGIFKDPWDVERFSRQYLFNRVFADKNNYSHLIFTDVDEILKIDSFSDKLDSIENRKRISTPIYRYFYNLKASNSNNGALIFNKNYLHADMNINLERTSASKPEDSLKDATGWHFSYCTGNADDIILKLKSFSHTEYSIGQYVSKEFIEECIKNKTFHLRNSKLSTVPINEMPNFIQNNAIKYGDKILI
jgi:beta-1,4-mannosyl-glycoprotein beta-1,4-N-acetylglucosaminyltransferase